MPARLGRPSEPLACNLDLSAQIVFVRQRTHQAPGVQLPPASHPRSYCSVIYIWPPVVQPAPIAPTVPADPDNNHVLACALVAKAELIVSGDSHRLTLHEYQGIPILAAADALRRVGAANR